MSIKEPNMYETNSRIKDCENDLLIVIIVVIIYGVMTY